MSRRNVFFTWRTPSRQMDIRFFSNLNDPLSAAAGFVCIKIIQNQMRWNSTIKYFLETSWRDLQISQSSMFFTPAVIFIFEISSFLFWESSFLVSFREFDVWSKTVHQHFIKKSSSKSSKFNHLSFWMANNYSSASQLSATISATKHACTGPRNYRSGHLCCDELYSSPDELLLVKWTSVLVLKIWTTRSRRRRWEPYIS